MSPSITEVSGPAKGRHGFRTPRDWSAAHRQKSASRRETACASGADWGSEVPGIQFARDPRHMCHRALRCGHPAGPHQSQPSKRPHRKAVGVFAEFEADHRADDGNDGFLPGQGNDGVDEEGIPRLRRLEAMDTTDDTGASTRTPAPLCPRK